MMKTLETKHHRPLLCNGVAWQIEEHPLPETKKSPLKILKIVLPKRKGSSSNTIKDF